jgi:hypothetical protein
MEVSGELHASVTFARSVRAPGTHRLEGSVGSRAGLEAVAKKKYPITAPTGNWTLVIDRSIVTILSQLPWLLVSFLKKTNLIK